MNARWHEFSSPVQLNQDPARLRSFSHRHEPTQAYMRKRTAEGKSKPEVIRCLKRYVAREIYTVLISARGQA